MNNRNDFTAYLRENTRTDTGTIKSYLKGMELLSQMIDKAPEGFADCKNIWNVNSDERLHALSLKVREEQKRKEESIWYLEGQKSYLQKGFCAAALMHYRKFLIEVPYEQCLLDIFQQHEGTADDLVEKLKLKFDLPKFLKKDLKGKESVTQVKVRTNQNTFRRMILELYQNRCCITGLDVPELNIASHIVGWAENKGARMDPRNGLCLSATFDKAFDQHLITVDEDFKIVVSKEIKNFYTQKAAKETFQKHEGQMIEMPVNKEYRPLQSYLAKHRELLVG